jgi:hypothetical protein
MKPVWTFTNQRELNKKEFLNYVERKVFRTIRKYQMLPKDKTIVLKKSNDLNTAVLKKIIETKFEVKFGAKPNINSENLSDAAEDIFEKALKGDFKPKKKINSPLYYLSDKELELYAKLSDIKGTKRKQNSKIQNLFSKFLKKNQDLELNVVKASRQFG